MNPTPQNEKGRGRANVPSPENKNHTARNFTAVKPEPTGQARKVLNLLRLRPHNSLELSREHGVLQYNARIKQLREAGWNIRTEQLAKVAYCGELHRGIGLFVLLCPEWPSHGFLDAEGPQ